MRFEQLEYLVSLKETLSLTKTADIFLTSHQVINNAIKKLESEFDVTILNRTHRGIQFTEAGLLLYEYAKTTLKSKSQFIEQLAPKTNKSAPQVSGELQIYAIPRFANKYFLDFLDVYRKRHSKLSISMKNYPFPKLLELSLTCENYIMLTTVHETLFNSSVYTETLLSKQLTYEVITSQPLGYCISNKSKYLDQILLQPDNNSIIYQIPIVTHSYSTDEKVFEGISPKNYLIDNFEVQKNMIKSGNYTGIWSLFEFQHYFGNDPTVHFIPFSNGQHFHYLAIYSKHFGDTLITSDFISSLKKIYQKSIC
ncbi:MAG: LysR family transcriptional regulator [Desulfitobacterium sp.]